MLGRFGLYLEFRCGIWEVLGVLDCIWDFGVELGKRSLFGLYLGFRFGILEVLCVLRALKG